jgi:adenosylhomocysteinase
MPDGRALFVLAEGRLVNLASGDGHPAEIMDMSFAIQAKCAEYLAKNRNGLREKLIAVPAEIDREVALLKLKSMGRSIDALSAHQKEYLGI